MSKPKRDVNDRDTFYALLRNDPMSFLRAGFNHLNPGANFLSNWNIEAILHQLKRVMNGHETRLIINLPPRVS